MTEFVDFPTLDRGFLPNRWLMLPAGYGRGRPHALGAVRAVPAAALAEAWAVVVAAQPRAELLGRSPDGLQVEAPHRTERLGFTDRISARAVPLTAETSALAVFSRSQVGLWDLGTNRRRIMRWLGELDRVTARS